MSKKQKRRNKEVVLRRPYDFDRIDDVIETLERKEKEFYLQTRKRKVKET